MPALDTRRIAAKGSIIDNSVISSAPVWVVCRSSTLGETRPSRGCDLASLADLGAEAIATLGNVDLHDKPGIGRGVADEVHHGLKRARWASAPVERNERE